MNRLSGLVFSLFVAIFLLFPRETALGKTLERIEGEAGIEIVISSPLSSSPQKAIPLRVKITNGSNQEGRWRLTTESRYYNHRNTKFTYREEMSVPSGSTQTFDFIGGGDQIEITGTGIEPKTIHTGWSHGDKFTAMSEKVALHSARPIEAAIEKASANRKIFELDLKAISDDWRVYAGLQNLFMTEDEWNALGAAQKEGFRRWVLSGGRLIFLTAGDPALVLKDFGSGAAGGLKKLGGGTVEAAIWNGKELSYNQFSTLIGSESESDWGGGARKEEKGGKAFEILFVIVFGILVGPVNLFVLAPSSKRSRLFYTTPLLSLGATVVLLAAILVGDGTGGKGKRFLVMTLVPGLHEALFDQYQTAQCGLLLSQTFTLKEKDSLFEPVNRQGDIWIEGDQHSGWFTNRGVNSHRWRVMRPTRASVVEVSRDSEGVPVVFSSFEHPLEKFFYKDTDGRTWRAESLKPGERVALQRVKGEAEFREWREKVGQLQLPDSRLAKVFSLNGGEFMAEVKGGRDLFIETLPSIDWSDVMVAKGFVEKGGVQ